ncbi:MAG: response regulator transcription factor [Flavobacteriales bacterium]|nr:response regulator transcription factor [Flavobacteriales bacterium]
MQRILLVEDEKSVSSFIKKGLTEEGYDVDIADTGAAGTELGLRDQFDLIILDIMLPDISGIEVCRTLREKGLRTPILFLTALNTPENIAWGLNTGGDDYLAKPFKFIELNARVKALLRRSDAVVEQAATSNVLTLADVVIDDDLKEVVRAGEPISLTATEYRLLVELVRNKGRVLSRMDLLERVWDLQFNLGTNIVDVYINYLRKKLDNDPGNKLIHTVVGMGYVAKEP